jgi:amidohydrolase
MNNTLFSPEQIRQLAERQLATQIRWRHHLHQHPEIANQEFKTTAFLKAELRKLGLKIRPLKMKTGVVADLVGGRGPTVAIRSDIDALPMDEKTGLKYASKNPGRMHACGHDFHMATVLGAAALLAAERDRLKGSVRFLFQPAEEDPPGGAERMVKEGVLEGVDTIFGLHVEPHLPTGTIGLCDGPMMAMVLDFDLVIHGRGSHAARPQFAVDAVTTAAEVIGALQKIVSRSNDPSTPLVLTVGRIEGGTARNVIAHEVRLVCTARTLSPELGRKISSMVRRTVGGVCKAYGATFDLEQLPSYPILINDPKTNSLYRDVFGELHGRRNIRTSEPVLGGEDFAYYLQKVPGAMLRLGMASKEADSGQPWHASNFRVDDRAMYYATSLLVGATLEFMEKKAR